MIDINLIWQSLPNLLQGTCISLLIAVAAAAIGLCLGTILALVEVMNSGFPRLLASWYVTVLRGTPMLIQILFVFYVLPQFGIMIDPIWAATLAIGLNSSAYISQTLRAGIESVPKGQIEAAMTLGFSRFGTMKYIVLPQAFRFALPGLTNELITLLKDSSLASIIGVMELSKEASIIRSRTYDAFSILLSVAIIYLVMTAVLSFFAKKIEARWKINA